jgi:hypothetical protein
MAMGKIARHKLSEVEGEAAGTEAWLEFATRCACLTREQADSQYRAYKALVRTVAGRINHPETWILGDGA